MDLNFILQLSILVIMVGIRTSVCMTGLHIHQIKDFVQFLHDMGQYWNMTSIYIMHHPQDSRSTEMNLILEELHTKDTYFSKLPQMSISYEYLEKKFCRDKGFNENSLVLTLMENVSDPILKITMAATRHRRRCFTVFAMPGYPPQNLLDFFFFRLSRTYLQRPLVILNGKVLLTLYKHPEINIRNVTGSHISKLFPDVGNIRDYRGHRLTVPILEDLPATFWYKNEKNNKILLDGLGGMVVSQFANHYNIQLSLIPYNLSNLTSLDANKKEIRLKAVADISPKFFTSFSALERDYSYPYVTTSRCVMMPLPPPSALRLTDLLRFPLVMFVLICVVLNEVFWTIYFHFAELHSKDYSWSEIFRSRSYRFISLICVFLSFSLPSLPLPPMKEIRAWVFFRIIIIYLAIIWSGFYISQALSTNFISQLTVSYYKVPSPNLKDILSSDIPLLVYEGEYDQIVKDFNLSRADLGHIESANRDDVNKKRLSLNTSYMYFVTAESFKFVDEQQKYLNTKLFILTDICHGFYSEQVELRTDSALTTPLQMFILHAREGGILQYLESMLFQRAKDHGLVRYLRDSLEESELALREHNRSNLISMMMQIVGIGYLVTALAFIAEILSFRLQETCSRRRLLNIPKVSVPLDIHIDAEASNSAVVERTSLNEKLDDCPLCKSGHSLRKCLRFRKMSVVQRWKTVQRLQHCFNCLAHSHMRDKCSSSAMCVECKAKHNTLLHRFRNPKKPQTALPANNPFRAADQPLHSSKRKQRNNNNNNGNSKNNGKNNNNTASHHQEPQQSVDVAPPIDQPNVTITVEVHSEQIY